MQCRHCCKQYDYHSGRGLCGSCYTDKKIRKKYRRFKVGRKRKIRVLTFHIPSPTDCPPGTAEKLEVLAKRVAKNQELWNPFDAPFIERWEEHWTRLREEALSGRMIRNDDTLSEE